MIQHTLSPLPNGKFLLKMMGHLSNVGSQSLPAPYLCIQTTEISDVDAQEMCRVLLGNLKELKMPEETQ
jgi:hypothetical protein